MASPKTVVASLADAYKQKALYPTAIGFLIAPLKTRTGKRAWHGINSERTAWEREAEGAGIAVLTEGVDDLPQLPHSPIELWELAYLDKEAEFIPPTIEISPSSSTEKEAPESPSSTAASKTIEAEIVEEKPLPPGTDERTALLHEMRQQLRDQHKYTLQLLDSSTKSVTTHRAAYEGLISQLDRRLAHTEKQLIAAEQARDAALGANSELQNQLAQERSDSQIHITIRELYKDKPEMLNSLIREGLGFLIEKLKS